MKIYKLQNGRKFRIVRPCGVNPDYYIVVEFQDELGKEYTIMNYGY